MRGAWRGTWEARAALAVALWAAGCARGDDDAARDTTAMVPPPPAVAPSGAAAREAAQDTVHAFEGTWDLATVEQRLADVGLQPVRRGTVERPFMGVPGSVFEIRGGGEVQVYVYGDAVARAQASDALDTLRVAPAGQAVQWRLPPTLIVSNNIAAIVLTNDADVRRRAREALQVGGRTPLPDTQSLARPRSARRAPAAPRR